MRTEFEGGLLMMYELHAEEILLTFVEELLMMVVGLLAMVVAEILTLDA